MVENLIRIKGGAYNDVKKALKEWIALYSKDLEDGLVFQLYKNGRGNHIIQADKRLDNERFFYLLNYLHYPIGIEYKIDINGFTVGKGKSTLKDENLLVYISSKDKEGDNVFVSTETGQNFKVDFGGGISKASERIAFSLPSNLKLESPEEFRVDKKQFDAKTELGQKSSIGKRFKILSLLSIVLLFVSFLVYSYDVKAFTTFIFFLGMGLAIWFFSDYKMLQSNKYYLYSFLIALIFLLDTLFIKQELIQSIDLTDLGAFFPISLLIVQKPARQLFKFFLKREPVVDKPFPTFWDGVYTIALFFGLVFLPFFLVDLLKW